MNTEDALQLIFPKDSKIEKKDFFLTQQQVDRIQKHAQSKLSTEIITSYTGYNEGKELGTAFLDTHRIRTMDETIMVLINPTGQVECIEILAFHEPEDYRPSKPWLSLFRGKVLNKNLRLKRGIRNITGSTLSTQAITAAVRRLLAAYDVLIKGGVK